MYRAIINSNTGNPEVKKVEILKTFHSSCLIQIPVGKSSFIVREGKVLLTQETGLDGYQVQVPLKELHATPEEALRSLKPEFENQLLQKCREISRLQNHICSLP